MAVICSTKFEIRLEGLCYNEFLGYNMHVLLYT